MIPCGTIAEGGRSDGSRGYGCRTEFRITLDGQLFKVAGTVFKLTLENVQ